MPRADYDEPLDGLDLSAIPEKEADPETDEDQTILWIPPRLVHAAAHDVLDRFIAGTRINEDDHSKRTVLRFTGERRGFVRVRDTQRLQPDPARIYQVTIRRTTPKRRPAQEWLSMCNGDFDLFATVWVDIIDVGGVVDGKPQATKLDVRSCVVLDVPLLLEDIRERPSCQVVDRATKKHMFRAPGGAMFSAVDIRRLRPETRVLVDGIEGEETWTPAPVTEHRPMFT